MLEKSWKLKLIALFSTNKKRQQKHHFVCKRTKKSIKTNNNFSDKITSARAGAIASFCHGKNQNPNDFKTTNYHSADMSRDSKKIKINAIIYFCSLLKRKNVKIVAIAVSPYPNYFYLDQLAPIGERERGVVNTRGKDVDAIVDETVKQSCWKRPKPRK